MNYLEISDVKRVPIADKISQAEWSDADIEQCIEEAENYVESSLVKLGYTREQLKQSNLVKKLMINYAWYAILRDIYTMQSPSVGAGQEYNKWRDDVNNILQAISEQKIKLTDKEGKIIIPAKSSFDIRSTTIDVKRAVHMGKDWEWAIDNNYAKKEITNIEK